MPLEVVRRCLALAAAALLALAGTAGAGGSHPVSAGAAAVAETAEAVDDEPDCEQLPPERLPVATADDGQPLNLTVAVLVAAADLSQARERNAVTAQTLRRASLNVRFVYYPIKHMPSFGGTSAAAVRSGIAFAKRHFRNGRPPGGHAVLLLSHEFDRRGFADCIGGALHPARAFAVAGLHERPAGVSNNIDDGVVAAHELGHLLGGQHHYGNCAQAQPAASGEGDLNACTLMSPLAITGQIGSLERIYIRDYARSLATR